MTFSELFKTQRASPADATWATHRMRDGDPCWSCGAAFSLDADYPSYHCAHCRAPFPRTCAGCRDLVMPLGATSYDEPPPLCSDCERDRSREVREKLIERMPDAVIRTAMCSYKAYAHRRDVDQALKRYLSGELLTPNLFIWGPPGTGKTIAAARCAWKVIVGDREITSFVWVTEGSLVRYATETKYGVLGEHFHEAVHAHLLVIDEVGSAYRRASDKARSRISDLLRSRLEDLSKRTIFVSNTQPLMGATFGEPVESRFKGTSHVLHLDGPDLRGRRE
jgi:DNA replication protein DnaC